ncbi:hypothetical protein ACQCT5_06595 [Sutcliffiella halmapala]
MIQAVSIEVDIDKLEKSNHIIGNISFLVDYHRFFPDEGWSDFVIIVLSWWIKSIKGLIGSAHGMIYEFNFMDGTPVVKGKKKGTDIVELIFYIDGMKEFNAICSISELKEGLLIASKKIIRAIERQNWSGEEIEELKDLVLSLERYPSLRHE